MRTENSLLIKGDIRRIYEYAAKVEDWPRVLPHYRKVEILEPGERRRVIEMRCVRDFKLFRWPCKWRAVQELTPEAYKITYCHVRGVTKGMFVEWNIHQEAEGVRAAILHELKYPVPIIGALVANYAIGPVFIHYIAGQTLDTIKRLVETEALL